MRLIYLSHCLPYPPNKGDRVRAFHAIRVLAEHGHEIRLLALAKPGEDVSQRHELEELCSRVDVFPIGAIQARWRSLLGLLGSEPLTHSYFYSRAMTKAVTAIEQEGEYDAVIAYSSAMIPYALELNRGPRLLDMVDVDSEKWAQYSRRSGFPQRIVFAQEARRLKKVEVRSGTLFDRVIVATSREEGILEGMCPGVRFSRIRNGVAPEFFESTSRSRSSVPTLAFMGQMDYLPNIDAAEFLARGVVPILQQEIPNLRLLIIGRSPATRVQQLSRIPGVVVTGTVDDVRPLLAESWVFVAPLRLAQGIQNKVLEAMAMGLPVVCSSGVHAGLEDGGFELGKDLLVADTEVELAEAVLRLLEDSGLRERMGRSSQERVRAVYDWDRNMGQMEAELRDLTGSEVGAIGASKASGQ